MVKDKGKPKGKPRGKPFKGKDPVTGEVDPRINVEGAPKRGSSMKEMLDYVDNLTAEEILQLLPKGNPLWLSYNQMPKGVPMKLLKAVRINAAIMFEPTAGLVKEITDRTDGKVPDKLDAGVNVNIPGLEDVLKKVYGSNSDANPTSTDIQQ